jgi:hypothetical protein
MPVFHGNVFHYCDGHHELAQRHSYFEYFEMLRVSLFHGAGGQAGLTAHMGIASFHPRTNVKAPRVWVSAPQRANFSAPANHAVTTVGFGDLSLPHLRLVDEGKSGDAFENDDPENFYYRGRGAKGAPFDCAATVRARPDPSESRPRTSAAPAVGGVADCVR